MDNRPTVAIMYDFDKTLSPKDMQEYGFIDSIGMGREEFWNLVNRMSRKENMDNILAYMHLMIRESGRHGKLFRREDLVELGKNVRYYPGVQEWFDKVDEYGDKVGVNVEHYIISSGLREMIEGTTIHPHFKEVFACEFLYDDHGNPCWVKNVVNYTTKTQFIYRINKGAMEMHDVEKVNEFVADDDRPIPFENMIYIGDGITDIPAMKIVHVNGGRSIAVYADDEKRRKALQLVYDERADFVCKADYSEGGELFERVCQIIDNAYTGSVVRMYGRRDWRESLEAYKDDVRETSGKE